MPRFSFVPTMNANNNCTNPRRLTRTHVRAHVSPGPTSKFRRPWYCAQCGQLVEPAGPCPKTHAEFRKVW